MNLYSSKEMTDLLERHNFFFKKNLGQNFLMNESIAARIADASFETVPKSGKKSLAIEIGPGAGSLTLQLAKRFDSVLALEIDPHLIGVLDESLADESNVKVVQADALAYDFSKVLRDYPEHSIAVCSNLPYYITSEIIMRLLESALPITSITVLIQKEAAVRLTSKPGSEQYGAITAAVGFYASSEKLFTVGPGNFIPRPKVDSAVLRLTPYGEPAVKVQDQELFFKLIRAAFGNRRKTLSNALSSALKVCYSKEHILKMLDLAEIDPNRRGETLSLEEYAKISDAFTNSR
ncbi:MAG: 16S rRNA (adenine(1518)-N(6)/adenine(1519)-N(6))-dimethyltransferase RsmA [Ruminococcaceae bacterium]|nr:16S rRNA (adenine(1518)-N(6)/adenine(1519)-N(6))-dimethyltransferase RsmA [Oscillospiraceae bacterium]